MPESKLEPRLAIIAAGVLAVILYGSLYPFQFHLGVTVTNVLDLFLEFPSDHFEAGDIVSNVLLYLPLGFFAALAIPGRRIVSVTVAGALLAVAIELVQSFDLGRDPSIVDAAANSIGTLLGALAAVFLRRDHPVFRNLSRHPFAMLLLAAWTGNRLLPAGPAFDIHRYGAAANSLRDIHNPIDVYKHFALWLAAAAMLDALLGTGRSRWAISIFASAVLAARVVLHSPLLPPSEIAGAILAALLWIAFLSRLKSRDPIIAALFVIFVALEALRPFEFSSSPRPFTWIPFLGFIEGPRGFEVLVFLEKTYIYGSLLWLVTRAGCSYKVTTLFAATFVFALRLTQVYIPGRSAEIADTLMVLILAGVMLLLEPQYRAPLAPYPPGTAAPVPR